MAQIMKCEKTNESSEWSEIVKARRFLGSGEKHIWKESKSKMFLLKTKIDS